MTEKSSNRLPWLLVTLLVVLNVAVLAWVWFRGSGGPNDRPGRPPHGGLAQEIGMNEAETAKMLPLQEAHFGRLDAFQSEIVRLRQAAFHDFGLPAADTTAAMAALREIGAVAVALETERYRHFHEVLALCTPAEADKFREIMPVLLGRRNQPENDPHRRGGPGGPH